MLFSEKSYERIIKLNFKTLSRLAAALIFFGILPTKAESKQNMGLTINIYYSGQSGNAVKFAEEIKTGKRRVIEYLLSPVMKYLNESMRER